VIYTPKQANYSHQLKDDANCAIAQNNLNISWDFFHISWRTSKSLAETVIVKFKNKLHYTINAIVTKCAEKNCITITCPHVRETNNIYTTKLQKSKSTSPPTTLGIGPDHLKGVCEVVWFAKGNPSHGSYVCVCVCVCIFFEGVSLIWHSIVSYKHNIQKARVASRCYLKASNRYEKSWLATTFALDPTFGSFTLLELVFLVQVFGLFRLEWIFFFVQSVDTPVRCTTSYLLAGPACLWCLVSVHIPSSSIIHPMGCTGECWFTLAPSKLPINHQI
jgi:hypothetical protein